MTLDERYESVVREPSDIQAHLPIKSRKGENWKPW